MNEKMRIIKIILATCFLFTAGFLLQGQNNSDEAAVKKALEEYLLAWEYKDFEMMYGLIPAEAVAEMKKEAFIDRLKNTTYFPVDFKIARIKIEDDAAKAWIDLYEKKDGDVRKETVLLTMEGQSWKV